MVNTASPRGPGESAESPASNAIATWVTGTAVRCT